MRNLTTVAITILISTPIMAQNLLTNGSFDTDIAGWENPYSRIANWAPLDANDSPISGSAALTNDVMNGGSLTILNQCIEVSAGDLVEIAAKIYHPSGQAGEGTGRLRINFYSDISCSTTIDSWLYAYVPSDLDMWHDTGRADSAPDTTAAVRLDLAVRGLSGGTQFTAHFDDVSLTATPSVVFVDGFENGDTSAWSSVTP